jgi:hypothetical protein
MIKYKTSSWEIGIVAVKVLRESDKSIWKSAHNGYEQRVAKDTSYYKFHDTWGEAHAHLMERATKRLDRAKRSLAVAESELATIKDMKNPEVSDEESV